MRIAVMILQMICALFLIVIIMLQSGKNSGLSGTIGGQSDLYNFQAQSKTWDARFARMTKWVALAFVILTFALVLM